MAAVDASIGIKTAVNFHGRKNKMGTYCAPLAVFIDKTFLKTLDKRHLSNGSAEILKMACIKDAELFELLEKHSKDLVASSFQVLPNAAIICMSFSVHQFLPISCDLCLRRIALPLCVLSHVSAATCVLSYGSVDEWVL